MRSSVRSLLALTATLGLTPALAAQTTHVVDQIGLAFFPADITIAVGDSVEWRWSAGMHDVTEGTDGTVDGDEAFYSPLDSGTQVFTFTFDAAFVAANPRPGGLYDYFCSFHFLVGHVGTVTVVSDPLTADTTSVSLSAGGTQNLSLDAGPAFASKLYLVAGSATGTSPGLLIDGVSVPLNADFYLTTTVKSANKGPFVGTLGFLSGTGTTASAIALPAGLDPSLAGLTLNHAGIVLDVPGAGVVTFASNAVPLTLTP